MTFGKKLWAQKPKIRQKKLKGDQPTNGPKKWVVESRITRLKMKMKEGKGEQKEERKGKKGKWKKGKGETVFAICQKMVFGWGFGQVTSPRSQDSWKVFGVFSLLNCLLRHLEVLCGTVCTMHRHMLLRRFAPVHWCRSKLTLYCRLFLQWRWKFLDALVRNASL